MIAVSWLGWGMSRSIWKLAVDELPLIYYTLWLTGIFLTRYFGSNRIPTRIEHGYSTID